VIRSGGTQGWGPVFHTVTTADAPLTWHPRFCYNGLRYLEISGVPTAPEACGVVLAAAADPAGTFTSSDPNVTELHRIIRRAITSNMYSMFTDCPQREKLGYLEQLHLVYPILRWNYDVRELLANTLRIVREAQEPSGHLALYVPEWDPFPDPWRGDVNFGLVSVFLPWQLYRTYGALDVLTANYDAAVRYVEHLLASRADGLVTALRTSTVGPARSPVSVTASPSVGRAFRAASAARSGCLRGSGEVAPSAWPAVSRPSLPHGFISRH
jgi:alpha-L-rhamnosidase